MNNKITLENDIATSSYSGNVTTHDDMQNQSKEIRISTRDGTALEQHSRWIPIEDFRDALVAKLNYLNQPIYELFTEVISNLLRNRRFYQLQLSFAQEEITEEKFDKEVESLYSGLTPADKWTDELDEKVRLFLSIYKGGFEVEDLSASLNVDETILGEIISKINNEGA